MAPPYALAVERVEQLVKEQLVMEVEEKRQMAPPCKRAESKEEMMEQ